MEHPLPPSYELQPQAYIKHKLLGSYLEKLIRIVGANAREICYVDCFAGPWGPPSEDMASTSIAISLRTLARCRDELIARRGAVVSMRALYVEENVERFGRLSTYLQGNKAHGVETKSLHGDFAALRGEILDWIGPSAFTFFFIDPTGFKEIGVPTLAPLLERKGSEFLINFMYDHINRNMSIAELQPAMRTLLGSSIAVDGMPPEEREQSILDAYRSGCKAKMPSSGKHKARSAYARVMDPKRERPKYHLVYLTSHPRGILAFMEISQDVDIVQRQVRATLRQKARETKVRMNDLFPALVDPADHGVSPDTVDSWWLTHLNKRGGLHRIGVDEFAEIIERTDWFPIDLQAALARLIKEHRVKNLDAPSWGVKRPKRPLHCEANGGSGETLALEGQA